MITPRPLSRREAIQRILAVSAALHLLDHSAFGEVAKTIGLDPKLHEKIVPWERVLNADEMKTLTALVDLIIPADDKSPAASAVGVPDFINEWVSAPYPVQVEDREVVQSGLKWLDEESQRRFQRRFTELKAAEHTAICDDLCSHAKARPEYKKAASFFAKVRTLAAGGFYTTPEGWVDLGYVGNKPMPEFPGPPPEVLKHLGLA